MVSMATHCHNTKERQNCILIVLVWVYTYIQAELFGLGRDQLPTPTEAVAEKETILDAIKAYHQCPLDEGTHSAGKTIS